MIFVTGDTHREIDISKLNSKRFQQGKTLTKNDFVIVVGDFGFLWDNTRSNEWWLKWISSRNHTTLFVDGNHENFDMLNSLPVSEWNGGKVHFINDSVIHLMRGQVFTIEGKKFFTFGGAESVDKAYRAESISWWPQEEPSYAEYNEGLANLEKHNNKVDIILSHTCSAIVHDELAKHMCLNKPITSQNKFFDVIEETIDFNHWYFGHFHCDKKIDQKHTVIYDDIIQIT